MHLKIDFRNKANSENQSAGGKKTGSNSAGASIRVIHVQAFYLSLSVDLSREITTADITCSLKHVFFLL